MIKFIGVRFLQAIPILFGVAVVIFWTMQIVPGDPVASLLGPDSTPEARAAMRAELGLDQPLPMQFVSWTGDVIRGDLGRSIAQQSDVAEMLFDALGNTLILTGFAAILAVTVGLLLGLVGARWPRSILAKVTSGISMAFVSMPNYAVGLALIILLSVTYPIFPSGGMKDPLSDGGGTELLRYLVLPGVTAAIVPAGIIGRMFRTSMLDVMSQDFVEALRARGLSERRIFRSAMHNSMPTLLTVAGLQIGYLLGGIVFVETIFNWPGVGLLVYQSIAQRDLPVIQAGVLMSTTLFVGLNILVDTLHGVIDPRVRL